MAVCLLLLAGCRTGAEEAPIQDETAAEAFRAAELLGRPTDHSISLAMTPAREIAIQVQWGIASGTYGSETPVVAVPAGQPFRAVLDGLMPDTRYFYRVRYRLAGNSEFTERAEGSFHTQRSPAGSFVFTVQSDSHLDDRSDLALYRRTLANAAADAPDFHVDLGDTFMCEKHSQPLTAVLQGAPDQATVDARYLYERGNFALLSRDTPLFLANGNHEGEAGWLNDGGGDNLAVWATRARQAFFLNPVPDDFYGGDALAEPFVGRRASWYSWQWGAALFVVLDPYWSSREQPNRDGWNLTLGERQYRWLRATLEASRAAFKFVFVHSLVGGLDGQMRGGIEAAPYFEWGGRSLDGADDFERKRPGWGLPIHALLVRCGVSAVFHGHDHLYARQELDGVVYQEVPQPGSANPDNGPALAVQYHYASGTIFGSSGHLRVTVGPLAARAEYVRAWLPQQETSGRKNGQVEDAWSVASAGGGVE